MDFNTYSKRDQEDVKTNCEVKEQEKRNETNKRTKGDINAKTRICGLGLVFDGVRRGSERKCDIKTIRSKSNNTTKQSKTNQRHPLDPLFLSVPSFISSTSRVEGGDRDDRRVDSVV